MSRAWTTVLVVVCLLVGSAGPVRSGDAVVEVEPNDGLDTAQILPTGATVTGKLSLDDPEDWYRFEAKEPTWIRASASGAAGLDLVLDLRDADGEPVYRLDGTREGEPETFVRRVRRGVGYLTVSVNPGGAPAAYSLRIEEVNPIAYKPSTEEIKAAIRRGLAFLAKEQTGSGQWEARGAGPGVTGLALMAFVGEGLPEHEARVAKAVGSFLAAAVPPGRHADDPGAEAHLSGCLVDPDSEHYLYEQAIAVLALAERYHAAKDAAVGAALRAGVDLLLRSQNTSRKPAALHGPVSLESPSFGGWRYAPENLDSDLSASGWCLIALAAAAKAGMPVPDQVKKDYMVLCRKCFDETEGKYAYQPGARVTNVTNSVGVLTTLLVMGGECPVVRIGLKNLKRNLPAWCSEGEPGFHPFYYWYYASRAMYVAGGDWWNEWQGVVCPMLLENQQGDGSWIPDEEEGHLGKPYATALAILILQLCSGNPPAYLTGMAIESPVYSCPQLVDDIESMLKSAAFDDRTKEDLIRQLREMIDRYRGE